MIVLYLRSVRKQSGRIFIYKCTTDAIEGNSHAYLLCNAIDLYCVEYLTPGVDSTMRLRVRMREVGRIVAIWHRNIFPHSLRA